MSTLVTDPPRSPPRPSQVALAAGAWAVVGAAVAAGGWVAGMVIARSLLDVQLVTHDIPAARFVEIGVRQAAFGGGWGLLAGLVVYGWTQVREKPVTGEDEPDEIAELGVPTGEGWPRSLFVAGKWAFGGAIAAAGAWTFGLLVGQSVLGISMLSGSSKSKAEQAALAAAEVGGACGLLAGLVVGLLAARRAGGYVSRGALGAVGGALVGLIGGGLAPLLAASLRRSLPVEVSSALGWAFVGALAGLVTYGWSRPKFERVEPPSRGRTRRLVPIFGLAALAVASAFAAVVGVLPDGGRWAAGGVALLAVAVLAVVVAAVVAAQDRRIRELERRMQELEWDEGA